MLRERRLPRSGKQGHRGRGGGMVRPGQRAEVAGQRAGGHGRRSQWTHLGMALSKSQGRVYGDYRLEWAGKDHKARARICRCRSCPRASPSRARSTPRSAPWPGPSPARTATAFCSSTLPTKEQPDDEDPDTQAPGQRAPGALCGLHAQEHRGGAGAEVQQPGEAFVKSQQHEGWACLSERYDDGGFTGGNLDRPALRRLMADLEAGRVDCVVVYKVDRLSRSLLDFARMMETFDKHCVSFVSVTQQFNTATSMGRGGAAPRGARGPSDGSGVCAVVAPLPGSAPRRPEH
jgi:hypothetical protein